MLQRSIKIKDTSTCFVAHPKDNCAAGTASSNSCYIGNRKAPRQSGWCLKPHPPTTPECCSRGEPSTDIVQRQLGLLCAHKVQALNGLVHIRVCSPNIIITDGEKICCHLPFEVKNRGRPRRNLISPRIANRCHQSVSVAAGTRQTTVAPVKQLAKLFAIHRPKCLP